MLGSRWRSNQVDETDQTNTRFDQIRARVALIIGPLLFFSILAAPLPLSQEAHRLAAVMALTVTFWIGEPIPVWATALAAPTLALAIGAFPSGKGVAGVLQIYKKFFDPILLLFVGGFLIAKALEIHGIAQRIARRIININALSATPARTIIGVGICTWFLSMWTTNTAVTALMLPIALGILKAWNENKSGRPVAHAMVLMLPFSATVGGLATPIGTAPNLIGIAALREAGIELSFAQWMLYGMPMSVLMLGALAILLTRRLSKESSSASGATAEVAQPKPARLTAVQRTAVISFVTAIALWLISGLCPLWGGQTAQAICKKYFSESLVALYAAALLLIPLPFKPRALALKEVIRINWGTIVLMGGGLALGDLMGRTGLAEAIGKGVVEGIGLSSPLALIAVTTGLAILLSEIGSNTATAAMLVPVTIGIAQSAEVDPKWLVLAVVFGCSFGFMFPISTPPNTIAYGTGLITIPTMARRGSVFDLIGFLIVVGWIGILSLL